MRGTRFILFAVVVLIVGLAGGYLFARALVDRELATIRTEPTVVPLVEPIDSVRLLDTLTVSGRVETPAGEPMLLSLPQPPIVTALPHTPGDVVEPGQILIEVQGRPVIVLRGAFQPWRSLSAGDTGPDVEQVQSALADLGVFDAEPDRSLGPTTISAVAELYGTLGYTPPITVEGFVLPSSEIVFVAGPVTLADYPTSLERPLEEGDISVRTRGPVVLASLTPSQAGVITVGTPVSFRSNSGERWSGAVVAVEATSTEGDYAIITDGPPITADGPVQLEFILDDTEEAVLVAPWAAVQTDLEGRPYLAVGRSFDSWSPVLVELGVTDGRRVEVTALEGSLSLDDPLLLNPSP